MTTVAFVAVYAAISTAVGMAYFRYHRWDRFLDARKIGGETRETLLHHLMLGAVAMGAAWPIGIALALYSATARRPRPAPARSVDRAGVVPN